MARKKGKIAALLLVLTMSISLLPTAAFAAERTASESTHTQVEESLCNDADSASSEGREDSTEADTFFQSIEDGAEIPDLPAEETGAETPDQPAEEASAEIPDQPAEETSAETPDQPAEENGTETPDLPTKETGAETPDQPAEVAGTETPDQPAEETGAETPDQPAEVASTETPDQPAEGAGAETPNQPAEVAGTETPDQPAEGAGVEIPGQPVEPSASLPAVPAFPEIYREKTFAGITVKVDAPEGAFPEGAYVEITPVLAKDVVTSIDGVDNPDDIAAFDITFYSRGGQELQPAGDKTVDVRFEVAAVSALAQDDATLQIYHVDDQQNATPVGDEVASSSEGAEVAVEAASFSVYAVTISTPENGNFLNAASIDAKAGEMVYLFGKAGTWRGPENLFWCGGYDHQWAVVEDDAQLCEFEETVLPCNASVRFTNNTPGETKTFQIQHTWKTDFFDSTAAASEIFTVNVSSDVTYAGSIEIVASTSDYSDTAFAKSTANGDEATLTAASAINAVWYFDGAGTENDNENGVTVIPGEIKAYKMADDWGHVKFISWNFDIGDKANWQRTVYIDAGPEAVGKTYTLIYQHWDSNITDQTQTACAYYLVNVVSPYTVTYKYDDTTTSVGAVWGGSNYVAKEPSEPAKDNFTFQGWYTGDNRKFDFSTPVTGDITLHAVWAAATAKVTVNYVFADRVTGDTSALPPDKAVNLPVGTAYTVDPNGTVQYTDANNTQVTLACAPKVIPGCVAGAEQTDGTLDANGITVKVTYETARNVLNYYVTLAAGKTYDKDAQGKVTSHDTAFFTESLGQLHSFAPQILTAYVQENNLTEQVSENGQYFLMGDQITDFFTYRSAGAVMSSDEAIAAINASAGSKCAQIRKEIGSAGVINANSDTPDYRVAWTVLKYENGDGWHIDGCLNKIGYNTVTYLVDGVKTHTDTVETGSSVKLWPNIPQKKGFSFSGWTTEGSKAFTGVYHIAADITVTAGFTANRYTVTYTAGNGTGADFPGGSHDFNANYEVASFSATGFAAPSGYHFTGWVLGEGSFAAALTGNATMPAGNVIYVAQYAQDVTPATPETPTTPEAPVNDRDGDDDSDATPAAIPDNPTPLAESPVIADSTAEIPDGETPLTNAPEDVEAEIPDEAAPLAQAPQTGDCTAVWFAIAAVSGVSLVWLALSNKRRKEDGTR